MAIKVFTGATDGDYGTAANWSPSGVPASGDMLVFSDQSTRGMDGSTQAAKAHSIVVEQSFAFGIGSSGTSFEPTLGVTTLIFNANSQTKSYISGDGTNKIARVLMDSPSATEDLLEIDGTVTDISVRNGKLLIPSTATVDGRINLFGSASSQITVTESATLTGVEATLNGGTLSDSGGIPDVTLLDGTYVLGSSAGIGTRLEVYGGILWWDATSTIALAEIFGGRFATRTSRTGRTLTTCNMYGVGMVDFRTGGHLLTITNPIRAYGQNAPLFPLSATHTLGI